MEAIKYAASAVAGLTVAGFIIAKLYPWIKYDLICLRLIIRTAFLLKKTVQNNKLMVDLFEERVDQNPKKPSVIFQGNEYSYEFIEKQMNKTAHMGLSIGIKKDEVIAMLLPNEPAFIWTAYGLIKIGAQPAFLNYNLRSRSLLHCIKVCETKILLVGEDDGLIKAVEEIYLDLMSLDVKVYVIGVKDKSLPDGFISLREVFAKASDERPSRKCRDGINNQTAMCYVYTSGTTGLPKAAVISHLKAIKGSLLMNLIDLKEDDIIYTPLPLYHSAGGLIGVGSMIFYGATMVLRSKFSASHFMEDCCKYKVTVIQYIGELLRYLCATPKSSYDRKHCIRVAIGNGLRPDVWKNFKDRFQVPNICEFYAATEGNFGLVNSLNKFGSVGRSSPLLRIVAPINFIKYDVADDKPVRGKDGFCIPVGINEPGLMVCPIKKHFPYDGYKGSRELSEKKILRNVFKEGDTYYNTGDLLEVDREYFVYFKDRLGDTFRWKGENVSTLEVANVLSDLSWIADANVYGVQIPGQDGRAGMASLSLSQDCHELSSSNLKQIYNHCEEFLPQYARPRFIRIQDKQSMTSTFKLQKIDLIRDGFDPTKVNPDPLYCVDFVNKTYVPMTGDLYNDITSGKVRL